MLVRNMNDKINTLKKWILESNHIVFFGGAGVSTESGLKDFRSKDGLYFEKYDYPPEEILSHHFFMDKTEEFYKFYKDKLNTAGFKPNITHLVLAKLEKMGKLSSVITQNIDGFHKEAGSKNVLELHGSIKRYYCMKCKRFFDGDYVFSSKGVPKCPCGGIIKPDVVLYEEGLDEESIKWNNREEGENKTKIPLDRCPWCGSKLKYSSSKKKYFCSNLVRGRTGKNLRKAWRVKTSPSQA